MADIASDTFPSPSQLLRTGGYSEHIYRGYSQQIQGNKEYKQYGGYCLRYLSLAQSTVT